MESGEEIPACGRQLNVNSNDLGPGYLRCGSPVIGGKKNHEEIQSLTQQILTRSRLGTVLVSNTGVDQLLGEQE